MMTLPVSLFMGFSAMPLRTVFGALVLALAIQIALPQSASAQTPVCNQIRAELASLSNAQDPNAAAAVIGLRTELGRIRRAMQQSDCNRSGFLFFNSAPPVCEPLKAQAAQIEARLRQADGGGAQNPRRAQLMAALQRYDCLNGGAPTPPRGVIYAAPQERGMFEQMFNNRSNVIVDGNPIAPLDPALAEELERKAKLGGRMAICVRTCDGFFFPVNFEGLSARDEHAAVCNSLCPAAQTQVFYMPGGADLDRAATRDGTPYSSIPAAFQYRQKRDETCYCKQPGQTWANAMQGVEDVVEKRKGDVIVTPEQALAMSRPKGVPGAKDRKTPALAPKSPEAEPQIRESDIPTAGNASSGIGPKTAEPATQAPAQGARREVTGSDGLRKQVRVVAPTLAPAAKAGAAP